MCWKVIYSEIFVQFLVAYNIKEKLLDSIEYRDFITPLLQQTSTNFQLCYNVMI
jgi:hypothetical protein